MSGKGTKSVRFALRAVFCGLSTLVLLTSCGGGGSGSIGVSTPPPISVSVSPLGATVYNGGSQTFTATVKNDPANAGVTWGVNDPLSELIDSTATSVTYKAPPNTTTPRIVTLFATSKTDPTKVGTATIYI